MKKYTCNVICADSCTCECREKPTHCLKDGSLCQWHELRPEWCKSGAWAYTCNDVYFRINRVTDEGVTRLTAQFIETLIPYSQLQEVRVIPWPKGYNPGRLELVIGDAHYNIIAVCFDGINYILQSHNGLNTYIYSAKSLLDHAKIEDCNLPCGLLQHRLEDGSWVN